jgi:phosphoribosylamine--glycine ligase
MMRMLVVGSGGREHALVWKLRQSRSVGEVICAPGNGGIEQDARCFKVAPQDQPGILSLVVSEKVDFVVVGPEAPLADGLADYLQSHGIPTVGPRRNAAQLESSKAFAKEFMTRHRIPTAACATYTRAEEALAYLDSSEVHYPLVVKADGLAAGKGVIIVEDATQARAAVQRVMIERDFGAAGDRLLLEEFLTGVEASYIVFTDGRYVLPAVAARDHKAAYDNDRGPNTGGMGAYSADNILGPELEKEILETIVQPVIDGMRQEGTPFQGLLYAGLMLTAQGPKVLEFNVRMGDPEGQVILPRLASDFGELCEAICTGRLKDCRVNWNKGAAVCVVLASGGYPGSYQKGKAISGLGMAAEQPSVAIFHSGTRRLGETLVTDGGRVLGVTAFADNLASAVVSAYEAVNRIHFDGMHYRRDIGAKGLL